MKLSCKACEAERIDIPPACSVAVHSAVMRIKRMLLLAPQLYTNKAIQDILLQPIRLIQLKPLYLHYFECRYATIYVGRLNLS